MKAAQLWHMTQEAQQNFPGEVTFKVKEGSVDLLCIN